MPSKIHYAKSDIPRLNLFTIHTKRFSSTNLAISRIAQLVERTKLAIAGGCVSGSSPDAGTKRKTGMEIYQGHICVTYSELTDAGNGGPVMSVPNYKALCRKRHMNIIRPGKGLGSYALIVWSTVPERFKMKYIAKYGDQEKKLLAAEKELKTDDKAYEYFSGEELGLAADKRDEYTLNASVLNRLVQCIEDQKLSRKLSNSTTPIAWDGIVNESERLRQENHHTLPKSEARLKDKIRQYRKEGYACLISGRLSNANSVKLSDEGREIIIAMKRSQFPVYTNMQIFTRYNEIAAERGWKVLKSPSTLTNYLKTVQKDWIGGAYGERAAKKLLSRRHTTILPQMRDSIWYGDGTKINLYYRAMVDGKWKAATLEVFEVVDAYSEVLLGYKIGAHENFDMMYWAYRHAIEFAGHFPVELVHDNQGGSKDSTAQAWMSRIARFCRPCTPENPTSKTIEAIFGRFQSQVLHQRWNYSGGNITAKSQKSRVDTARILANVQSLPTYDELVEIYAQAREEWNRMPHPKYGRPRIDCYMESSNAESTVLNPAVHRDIFWLTTKDASVFTADGIRIQVNGQTYRYEVFGDDGMPDLDWNARNIGQKFHVQYDPANMSAVRLCTMDPNYGLRFEAEARPKIEIHRAWQEQTEQERSFIRRQQHANKRQQVFIYLDGYALDRKYGQAFDQHGMRDPKLPGVSPAEFEQFAEEWRALHHEDEPVPAEILPDTVGQVEKQVSNMTPDRMATYNAYDKI